MTWLIIRTAFRKEPYVLTALARLGCEAWQPVQFVAVRPHAVRKLTTKVQLRAYKSVAILPKRIFVTRPDILDREVQSELRTLRHVEGLECGFDGIPVQIPETQINPFRATLERENAASLALAQASRRQKQKWRSLKDALLEMIDTAKNQMEQAA